MPDLLFDASSLVRVLKLGRVEAPCQEPHPVADPLRGSQRAGRPHTGLSADCSGVL